jgi:hypothetical protein
MVSMLCARAAARSPVRISTPIVDASPISTKALIAKVASASTSK